MYLGVGVKCPVLSDFNQIWIVLTEFNRNFQYKIARKSIQWDSSSYIRADGRTDIHDEANGARLRERAYKLQKL